MPVLCAPERKFDEVDGVAVAIRRIDANQLHCGLLYKSDDDETRLLHLAFHHRLLDEKPNEKYRWADVGLDPFNRQVFAALASLIAEGSPAVPYGFDASGVCFDPSTGKLIPPPLGKGLTCATFILAVFKTYGYELVDEGTWKPRADDLTWQETILSMLKEKATQDHVDAVASDVGAMRFRPAEVVGAATCEVHPVAFDDACSLADEIVSELAA